MSKPYTGIRVKGGFYQGQKLAYQYGAEAGRIARKGLRGTLAPERRSIARDLGSARLHARGQGSLMGSRRIPAWRKTQARDFLRGYWDEAKHPRSANGKFR